ncbi:MAG: hypothetical protein K8R58_13610 [Bacteroidales bacterium]|nr:hypothetical protein [Bacteroidales bacterium]
MRIKFIILLIFIAGGKFTSAQLPDIVAMEYYFDTDPGFGNGEQVTVTSDSIVNADFDADLSLVNVGYHKLFVRTKDENGKWSLIHKQDIYKANAPSASQPLPNIVQIEYYFDTDPGYGNGEQVAVSPDSIVDINFEADLSLVNIGYHKLFVRIKDENGKWSLVLKQDVYKTNEPSTSQPLPDIVQMEYYFDTDPGYGNGEQITITSDSIVDANFDADLSLVDVGYHKLFVRTKDENGKWSLIHKQDVYKANAPSASQPLPDIVQMEYYFDIDPGYGNGEQVYVTSDSIVDANFDADLSLVDVGYHKLFVRTKDENGKWSLVLKQNVYKANAPSASQPLPYIVQSEYFIDNDPGYGNGTQIPVTSDSLIIETFVANIPGLSVGKHYLFFRVKNENGKWSLTNYKPFYFLGLHAYLEGPFNSCSGEMQTDLNLNGLLPLQQPYDSNASAVWYYTGNENVTSIPNTDIIDWLIIQTRDATSPANATSATIKETQAVFLLKDGTLVGLDGNTPPVFIEPVDNNLYVVIFHRNHLGVMSGNTVPQSGADAYTYDFSTGAGQAYGGANGHKEIGTGVWGMIGGDGDANSQIENADKNDVWAIEAGSAGYLSGDFTMDTQVNNTDKNNIWLPNSGKGGQVPDNIPQGGFKCMVPE